MDTPWTSSVKSTETVADLRGSWSERQLGDITDKRDHPNSQALELEPFGRHLRTVPPPLQIPMALEERKSGSKCGPKVNVSYTVYGDSVTCRWERA